jgi:oxygen-dependent protoporphyrinogen oxidase
MSRTVVVGAGLAGLTVAHALKQRGEEVVLLEGGTRAGGAIRAERRDGFLLESGPNSFMDRAGPFRDLVDALGLRAAVVPADPAASQRYVMFRGKPVAVPSRPPELLRTPLLSTGGKLRLLAEPLLARRGSGADESVEEFGLRHFGPESTARVLDALQTGIYAGRIDELSMQSCFPQLLALETEARSLLLGLRAQRKAGTSSERPALCSFVEGMGQLVDARASSLEGALRLSRPVQRIEKKGPGFRLASADGELLADRLIVATHPRTAAPLLAPLDVVLGETLRTIPHAPIVVAHLGLPRERVNHPLDGFGFLVPAAENRRVLGCIFSSSLFPGRAPEGRTLLTALLGGRRHPELVDLEERALAAVVRDEMRALLDVQAMPELLNLVRHPLGIPQYVVGHGARLETLEARLAAVPGLYLCGWGYRGVGVLDVVAEATALAERLHAGRAS